MKDDEGRNRAKAWMAQGFKKGGTVKDHVEVKGHIRKRASRKDAESVPSEEMANGGMVHLTGGARGGRGRLEKAKAQERLREE